MLKTETTTRAIEARVMDAASQIIDREGLCAHFEHGQWWITEPETGAAWSVVDAEGGTAVDGFDFEQVAEGEE